ncbi:Uma2 family endonuclease [Alienimonas sp. DA493]|uniref:Uma2 family endonuclease n=1 Tax=Alienimonas sp. DA493 TaxID=3373605 RepID=UPI0037549D12
MDAATFAATRADLPDGGRWTELIEGEPVAFAPPEPLHGTFVLNLSKAFAAAAGQGAANGQFGVGAVFETGLQTAADPDTVRFPAACLFARGVFEQMDREIANAVPALVVEVPGTPDRRREVGRRIEEYHAAGVAAVWIADLSELTVTIARPHAAPQTVGGSNRLTTDVLPAFGPTVEELFAEPEWWTRKAGAA